MLPPTRTPKKVRLESLVLSTPALVVLAASGIAIVGLEASLRITRFPVADWLDEGVNVTLRLLLWPAPMVKGRLTPPTANPLPNALAFVIVMLELPVLVNVSERV